MAKRGPKRDRYEAADRIYRLRALELVRAGQSRWAASQAVVDDDMAGIGSDYAKARRIHAWLLRHRDAPLLFVHFGEARNAIADALGKLAAKKRN